MIGVIDRIRSGTIIGANVTMPHKGVAFENCDEACGLATALRAVNTLYLSDDGLALGTNTDVHGVARSIAALGCATGSIVLLGAGGAAAAAVAALAALECNLAVINRDAHRAQTMVERLDRAGLCPREVQVAEWGSSESRRQVRCADLVINATALGMGDQALAGDSFRKLEIDRGESALLDLIYSIDETPFLKFGAGRSTLDGATMLVEQGARSFELWTGRKAPLHEMYLALFSHLGRAVPALPQAESEGSR
jgi:shikimate dehydrogenase